MQACSPSSLSRRKRFLTVLLCFYRFSADGYLFKVGFAKLDDPIALSCVFKKHICDFLFFLDYLYHNLLFLFVDYLRKPFGINTGRLPTTLLVPCWLWKRPGGNYQDSRQPNIIMYLTYKLIFFSIAPNQISTFARCEESHLLLIYLLCHDVFVLLLLLFT